MPSSCLYSFYIDLTKSSEVNSTLIVVVLAYTLVLFALITAIMIVEEGQEEDECI